MHTQPPKMLVDTSNQINPWVRIKESNALYKLTNFMLEQIHRFRNEPNKENVNYEIEARLGKLVLKNPDYSNPEIATVVNSLQFIENYISPQGLIIINDLPLHTYLKFEPDIFAAHFDQTAEYFKFLEKEAKTFREQQQKQQQNPQQSQQNENKYNFIINSIKQEPQLATVTKNEQESDIILDIFFENGQRISYYLTQERFNCIKKEKITDSVTGFDIMRNKLQYRIQSKKEIVQKDVLNNLLEFIESNNMSLFRIKNRQAYRFQFMEFSFTEVMEVSKNNNNYGFIELEEMILNNIGDTYNLSKQILKFFQAFYYKKNDDLFSKQREIEVEIYDISSFLHDSPKIIEMKLRAFLKNIEVLYQIPDGCLNQGVYQELFQQKYFEQERVRQLKQNQQQNGNGNQNAQQNQQLNQNFVEPLFLVPEIGSYGFKDFYRFAFNKFIPDTYTISKE